MFMDVREVLGPKQDAEAMAEPAGAALLHLNAMHNSIGGAVAKEATAMARIFPDPSAALAAFVTRIFEQRLKVGAAPVCLQRCLELQGPERHRLRSQGPGGLRRRGHRLFCQEIFQVYE